MTVELNSECFDVDNNGNVYIYTDDYEYMFCNRKMYVRPKLNTSISEDEYFDYTNVEDFLK